MDFWSERQNDIHITIATLTCNITNVDAKGVMCIPPEEERVEEDGVYDREKCPEHYPVWVSS